MKKEFPTCDFLLLSQMEFAVQMSCKSCEDSVKSALDIPGEDQ